MIKEEREVEAFDLTDGGEFAERRGDSLFDLEAQSVYGETTTARCPLTRQAVSRNQKLFCFTIISALVIMTLASLGLISLEEGQEELAEVLDFLALFQVQVDPSHSLNNSTTVLW